MSIRKIKPEYVNDYTGRWGPKKKMGTFMGGIALWVAASTLVYITISLIKEISQ